MSFVFREEQFVTQELQIRKDQIQDAVAENQWYRQKPIQKRKPPWKERNMLKEVLLFLAWQL